MSSLKIYTSGSISEPECYSNHEEIAKQLEAIGIRFQRWEASADVKFGDQQDEILAAYSNDIQRLLDEEGFVSVDVISVSPETPEVANLRKKFLSEHTHSEDEVRMFVDGQGLFYLHVENRIFAALCERGDLISVPANTPHWFDMGEKPRLAAIRFFNNTEGWVAHYTGSNIAENYPLLEQK